MIGDVSFLMYRVELKATKSKKRQGKGHANVPNVPCGVERFTIDKINS